MGTPVLRAFSRRHSRQKEMIGPALGFEPRIFRAECECLNHWAMRSHQPPPSDAEMNTTQNILANVLDSWTCHATPRAPSPHTISQVINTLLAEPQAAAMWRLLWGRPDCDGRGQHDKLTTTRRIRRVPRILKGGLVSSIYMPLLMRSCDFWCRMG